MASSNKPIQIQYRQPAYSFLFVDASSDGVDGKPRLGGLLIDAEGKQHTFSVAPPITTHGQVALTIEHYETMAVHTAQLLYADKLLHGTCIVSVDNTGELYALIKCTARSTITARYATRIACWNARSSCRIWYRYVNTNYNPADTFTRSALMKDSVVWPAPTTSLTSAQRKQLAELGHNIESSIPHPDAVFRHMFGDNVPPQLQQFRQDEIELYTAASGTELLESHMKGPGATSSELRPTPPMKQRAVRMKTMTPDGKLYRVIMGRHESLMNAGPWRAATALCEKREEALAVPCGRASGASAAPANAALAKP